jgi:hypothetical protein
MARREFIRAILNTRFTIPKADPFIGVRKIEPFGKKSPVTYSVS